MTRRAIFSAEQVRQIRKEHRPGVRGFGYESLAKKHGCAPATIRDLITMRTVRYMGS